MNAKQINNSHRLLFHNGLDVSDLQQSQQEKEVPHKFELSIISECPCGCGTKNKICESRKAEAARSQEQIEY